jgi:hypothetical protein
MECTVRGGTILVEDGVIICWIAWFIGSVPLTVA